MLLVYTLKKTRVYYIAVEMSALLWKLWLRKCHVLVPAVLTVQLWICYCVGVLAKTAYLYKMNIIIWGCVLMKMNSNKIRRKYWSSSCWVCRTCSTGTVQLQLTIHHPYHLLVQSAGFFTDLPPPPVDKLPETDRLPEQSVNLVACAICKFLDRSLIGEHCLGNLP